MTDLIAASLYATSLLFQISAFYFSFQLFRRAGVYRLPCLFLMLGFLAIALRQINLLINTIWDSDPNQLDALIALITSGLFMLGMHYLTQAFSSIEIQSSIFEQDAKVDAMTGALRRQETFERFEQEINRSFRNRQPLALIMIDIDHFKFVNDRYGHLVGNVVLKNLAMSCQQELRDVDIFGRVGGEEFLAILPNTHEDAALMIAERLRIQIENSDLAHINNESIRITISCGIAIFKPENEFDLVHPALVDKYFQQADLAMYQAKQRGRNQSVVWSDSESA
ncbi:MULTISPECIES: GGDEF domain-containing protein [unclassified Polynucleobacter]|uniref:GGDEF domain-containing protein n=1 Tax=unclassified Polynucleobacter TaxID=2640945 RepID=UPI0025739753|nr:MULTISPECIES: GGDEF domain-containing protein [unclassified Polynucleobacter]BEI42925.1 hypothetical protein PHIN10_10740 [Polynucleobacter sp. HIN10]BEI44679.1 hypothetical protein PHIN11_10510 [Polynucleobacter sp. HIN11]